MPIDESGKGIAKRGQKHSEQPLTTASLRQELLEAAGFDRDAQIEIMYEVVESAKGDLKAMKETPGFFMGELKDVHKQPDHPARAKARDQLVDIIGASGKASGVQHDKGPRAEIPLPPWMLNMTFNGTNTPNGIIVEGSPIVDEKVTILEPTVDNKDDISHL